jgi:hypothetical protein
VDKARHAWKTPWAEPPQAPARWSAARWDLSHTLLRQGDAKRALAVARQALNTVHVQARDFERKACAVGGPSSH